MSVLLVNLAQSFGGGEIYCERLIKLLQSDVDFVAIISDKTLYNKLINLGIPTIEIKRKSFLRSNKYLIAFLEVMQQILSKKINVICLNGTAATYLTSILSLFHSNLIVIRHTSLELQSNKLKQNLYRFSVKFAQRVICISQVIAQQHAFLNNDKVVVISNWVNSPKNSPEFLPLKQPQQIFRLLYVGRLVYEKGITDLVKAVNSMSNIHLDIVGDGPQYAKLQSLADLKLITFHGFLENLELFYKNSDLLILPSYSEGMPMVILEAMTNGLPCLGSNIPAIVALSQNGRNMTLFECGNLAHLVEQLKFLAESPDIRLQLAKQAQIWVNKQHSAESARQAYLNLLG